MITKNEYDVLKFIYDSKNHLATREELDAYLLSTTNDFFIENSYNSINEYFNYLYTRLSDKPNVAIGNNGSQYYYVTFYGLALMYEYEYYNKTHELATEANKYSYESNKIASEAKTISKCSKDVSIVSLIASILSIIVSILIAFFG